MAQITLGKAWGKAHHLYLWLCCKALPQGDLASILGEGLWAPHQLWATKTRDAQKGL